MKKHLFSFLPVHPIFFLVLSSTCCSDVVYASVTDDDTAYYYSEQGKLLYRHVHAAQTASYVIKTNKTFSEIFPDVPQDDPSLQLSEDYTTAAINGISRATARQVKRLIRRGAIDHPLVVNNIIPVLPKRIIRRMYDNIVLRCITDNAHKEHGGVVLPDGTVTCLSGELSDPRWLKGATLAIHQKALVYYHSHPGGTVEHALNTNYSYVRNANQVQFAQTNYTQTISYVQGPSRQDQDAVGEGVGYVFGMKAGVELIYIYNKNGIMATLPIAFVKKMQKATRPETPNTATDFAGLLKAAPYRF